MTTPNQNTPAVIDGAIEVVQPSALEVMQRAEIDLQISTAHKFPRSMQKFAERARAMALIDEDTAASCIYSRPVGGGKFAEGLSVRAAEIVAASFGNLRVAATVIEQTDRYVKARGFAHDLESNYACATEVIESTVKRDGTPYDERMRIVIAKSALAKARRDATFQVVPKALFKAIEGECRKLALGEGQSVSQRRARIVQWITKLAIEPKRVWKMLGIQGEADMTDEHFLTLTGLKTAIAEGEATIDEAFPKIIAEGAVGKTPTEAAAEEQKPKPTPTPEKPPVEETPPKSDPVETPPNQPVKKEEPKPQPSGPNAADLRNSVIKKCATSSMGKAMFLRGAAALGIVGDDAKLEMLDRDTLAALDERFEEVCEEAKK